MQEVQQVTTQTSLQYHYLSLTHQIRFQNQWPLITWGFTSIWLSMLVSFSYVFFRDGAPEGYSTEIFLAVLLLFWLGGAGLVAYAASKPCLIVAVDDSSSVRVT